MNEKIRKYAYVMKWPNKIIVGPINKNTDGIFFDDSSFDLFDRLSSEEIGDKILKQLNNSCLVENVSFRDPKWLGERKIFLNKLNFKSERQFMENLARITVMKDEGRTKILLWNNNGTEGDNRGFSSIKKEEYLSKNPTALEIGNVVEKFFSDKTI